MDKEEILKKIIELPKVETNNPISAMNSINVDDLMNIVDRLNKIPNYNDLLKENKKQKEVIDKAKKLIEHFKLTEWGMNGHEPLNSIQNILNENEVSE